MAGLAVVLLALAPAAHASKQAVDFFGGEGTLGGQFGGVTGVAINDSGAGPANPGDVYATDSSNNRIERFGRDDNATPANTADDTYFFISAWGADVVQSGGSGDLGGAAAADYEICTVASQCKAALASPGNGTLAGDGSLGNELPNGGLALDQDTGNLYVSDPGNARVDVYAGDGAFLRSFGYDVVATGPGNAGSGYEICLAASADVCKAGLTGSGSGQIGAFFGQGAARGIAFSAPDANPATGIVFLADRGNRRVDTYNLDGTSPASIGSAAVFASGGGSFPRQVAVDSRGILYADNTLEAATVGSDNRILRYDTQNANGGGVGFIAPITAPFNEDQQLLSTATAGQYRLTFGANTTGDLSFDASVAQVKAALEALPGIGAGSVSVNGICAVCGSHSYDIRFIGALANTDVAQLVVSNGTTPLTGAITVKTWVDGHGGPLLQNFTEGLAVDPDADGPGSDTDLLYALRGSNAIQQFGPINTPGLAAAPIAADDTHGTNGAYTTGWGVTIEPSTGRLYVTADSGEAGRGVYVLDNASPTPPTATLDSIDNLTSTSADLHATINPNGPPATRYHFEYSTDGVNWLSTPDEFLGVQETPQAIDETLKPLPIGLAPNTAYHVRVVAVRKFANPVVSNQLNFTTDPSPPLAETAGGPVRTTTTAQLNGRVTPLGSATSYHFQYGSEGPCDANPCTSTPSLPAGQGQLTQLVAEEITELAPATTYHYRLVAENGVGTPVAGADVTVITRSSNDLPGQSDKFPGPPGSDRAWEQVSIPESSGNPVGLGQGFSTDGDRAAYGIFGGTPISSTGSLLSTYFAQRPPGQHPTSGWQAELVTPPREALVGSFWWGFMGPDDLSSMVLLNEGFDSGARQAAIWRLDPASGPTRLFQPLAPPQQIDTNFGSALAPFGVSADGSRAVAPLDGGALDPAYPAAAAAKNLYDIDSSPPRLISLLPGNLVSPCGIGATPTFTSAGVQASHWISADGSLVYFPSRPAGPCGPGGAPTELYLREVESEQTKLLSPAPVSGPDCGASFVRATPGAAFFTTTGRLDSPDLEPSSCNAAAYNDVYRYDLASGSLKCVTCALPGFAVGVLGEDQATVAVSEDGSHVYFSTNRRLLPGAPPGGGAYRLDVQSGDLAYVAQIGGGVGTNQRSIELSPDGRVLIFSSSASAFNPLGATTTNAGTLQYYRYDDADRSLICVSCPTDGSAPLDAESGVLVGAEERGQPNTSVLSADGEDFAFATDTPLVSADQNTPRSTDPVHGQDLYEWRDGRLLLVTDGLTEWSVASSTLLTGVKVYGLTPSGHDLFFTAPAAYTPDTPDALKRLYDARIGGGIDFPPTPQPCALEVCQGTPQGAPEEQPPGTSDFRGPGNPEPEAKPCPKGKHRVHGRCVKKHRKRHHKRANHRAAGHNRRAGR